MVRRLRLNYCAEYRKILEQQASKIRELETIVQERESQLQRFSEAYKKLKASLEFYVPQIEEMKRQKYSLRKQYETAVDEERKKLQNEFKQLSSKYKEFARTEIAKAVEKVRADRREPRRSARASRSAC